MYIKRCTYLHFFFTNMAYCTVKWLSLDVPFPAVHCRTFLKFTEEKTTLVGPVGEEGTEGKRWKTFNMSNYLELLLDVFLSFFLLFIYLFIAAIVLFQRYFVTEQYPITYCAIGCVQHI